jgi:hypothetical protein
MGVVDRVGPSRLRNAFDAPDEADADLPPDEKSASSPTVERVRSLSCPRVPVFAPPRGAAKRRPHHLAAAFEDRRIGEILRFIWRGKLFDEPRRPVHPLALNLLDSTPNPRPQWFEHACRTRAADHRHDHRSNWLPPGRRARTD